MPDSPGCGSQARAEQCGRGGVGGLANEESIREAQAREGRERTQGEARADGPCHERKTHPPKLHILFCLFLLKLAALLAARGGERAGCGGGNGVGAEAEIGNRAGVQYLRIPLRECASGDGGWGGAGQG